MFNILENFDFVEMEYNGLEYICVVVEVMKWVILDKDKFVGDFVFFDVLVVRLIDKVYVSEMVDVIKVGEKVFVDRFF